jgi:tetratricopeptide (TPR) repeat protein
MGLDAALSGGLSLLARAYHWGWGDIPRARVLLQRAAQLIEAAREPNLEPLLEGARCLAYLEMDMDRTYRLFEELGALHNLAELSVQYQWGLGLVRAWKGELDGARAALTRAIELATARADHWVVFECTARLALLELEAGAVDPAAPLCARIASLAGKLGEGSEAPYASAIGALHAAARGDPNGDGALDVALAALERIDARFLIPDLLGIAAEIHLRAKQLDGAQKRAESALQIAEEVARPAEAARAHAVLACVAAERGDVDTCRSHLTAGSGTLPGHVEGLAQEAERIIAARLLQRGGGPWR